jgi:hypothetical protein
MTRNEKSRTPIRLDWSRLLGFDQVVREGDEESISLHDGRLTKVGVKPCRIRNFAMVGTKQNLRFGQS